MRALVWDGVSLTVDEVSLRPPGPGEVEVSISTAGLCHSDVSPMEGRIPQATPVILGHEAVGRISALGDGVDMPLGRRVVLTVLRRCGHCMQCRDRRPTLCRSSAAPVESPFSVAGESVHQFVRLGAFAERIVVTQDQVIPMPEGISDPVAAMLGCATVTAFGAVEERARVRPGETVLVTGAGGIGLNVVIAARAAGASRIVVVDKNPGKGRIARVCGATDFIASGDTPDLAETLLAILPDGFDTAFECAGHTGLMEATVAVLGWGGRAVVVGLPPTGATMDLSVRDLFHDKAILGCRMGSVDPHQMLPRLAERVLSGELDLEPLISAIVPMGEAATLVADLRQGRLDRGFISVASDT